MTEAKDPRDEAERLIASVLGGASLAADGLSGWATGSDECCVCPVCRAIAAARQPNPNVAERLASGAGDLAQGLASVLRAFSSGFPGSSGSSSGSSSSGSSGSSPSGSSAPAGSTTTATDEDPWHVATRAAAEAESRAPGSAEPAAPPNPPKPMAKKATKPKAAPEPEPEPQPDAPSGEEG
jgi:hypothetical protein